MPGIASNAKKLMHRFYDYAPKKQQPKIQKVIDIYKRGTHVNYRTVENTVIGLYSPSLVGKQKADRMYDDYIKAYDTAEVVPKGLARARRQRLELEGKLDKLKGIKKTYQLEVILYTQERKTDPTKDRPVAENVKIKRDKKHKGLIQFWKGDIQVEAQDSTVLSDLKWKLTTHGTKEWRKLYTICMTDNSFKERDIKFPGYLDGIYIKDWNLMRADGARVDPRKAAMRAAGDKFAIQFRYSSTELDLNKSTFRAALHKSSHRQNECWTFCPPSAFRRAKGCTAR